MCSSSIIINTTLFYTQKKLDTTHPRHPTTFCTTPHYAPTTLCSKKIANYSLYIYTHTHESGGGGYLRFTSSALFFLTHTHTNAYTQRKGRRKLETEKRKWEIPVLFVIKMKIRHVQMMKWRKVKVKGFCLSLFTLHTHKMQVNSLKYN